MQWHCKTMQKDVIVIDQQLIVMQNDAVATQKDTTTIDQQLIVMQNDAIVSDFSSLVMQKQYE